ncbi:MAG: MATE family efflux transporter [Lentimicrobiaceae bacterium]|jgi:MATE family multidrug resistance protein|nr:MATE family efflux transporter [Lentimicrobiaceae bacterium]
MFSFKEYFPYYKRNLKVAIPVVISQAGQITVMLADNIMVGHLGAMELAAVSFSGSLYMIGMIFGMGFTLGVTPLVGIAYGENKFRKAGLLFQNALLVNLFSTVIFMSLLFSVNLFLDRLGQEAAVVDLARPFYNIMVWSFLPQMIFFSGRQFAEGIGNTKIAMIITIFCNILNVVLNYGLIYGKLGLPEKGITGAAIATLISRIGMAVLMLFALFRLPIFNRYFIFFRKDGFNKTYLKNLFKVGGPISIQTGIEVLTFSLCGIMIGWISGVSLAANQVTQTMSSLTFMIALGVSSATTIRVSHQLGEKNYIGMRKAGFASMHLALAFMSVSAFCFIVFRNYIPYIFTSDEAVIAISSQLLVICGIYQVFDGLQVVAMAALRGMADTKVPMYISFVSYLVVCLSVGYFLAFVVGLGAVGIWWGYVVGLSLAAIWLSLRFIRKSREILLKHHELEIIN